MRRVATFAWQTAPPTSVDEALAVYDDGTVVLVVRTPRQASASIGSYTGSPSTADHAVLAAAGPGPVTFDLLAPPADPVGTVLATADRVADACRSSPRAVVTFHAHAAGPATDGVLAASLLAVGSGTQDVGFELDPAGSSVHFLGPDGQTMSWQDLPPLPMGFITPDAESLGGVVESASIAPGAYGAIAFETTSPAGATAISILVAGWLRDAFPDDDYPERFQVRTATASIPG